MGNLNMTLLRIWGTVIDFAVALRSHQIVLQWKADRRAMYSRDLYAFARDFS